MDEWRYCTICGSFHNFACVRKISCCRPKFAFQCVFLKHIKIPFKKHFKNAKPATLITHTRDLSTVEITEGPVSISNSKSYHVNKKQQKTVISKRKSNKALETDVRCNECLNNHTQNTRRGHIQAMSYSYFHILHFGSNYYTTPKDTFHQLT